jgi:hypothetical protein
MNRHFLPTSLVLLFTLGIAGCSGSPPPEPASSVDESKATPTIENKADSPATTTESASMSEADSSGKTAVAEKAPATSADANDCPRGGCRYTCATGKVCDEKCKGGACDLKVEKDAKGSLDCPSGSCKITCLPGATCNLNCSGGYCKSVCLAGSTCNVDCGSKDGQCETECAKGATCEVKCPTNNCKPEPKKGGKK